MSSLIKGYPNVLKLHSNNQNKYINGMSALYRKITTQQTKQNINCTKPHTEKNLEISSIGSGSASIVKKFPIS
jgi:hypothetical protein